MTFYAELPPFRFQHTEETAFFQGDQHIISAKVLIRHIERRRVGAQSFTDFDAVTFIQKHQHAVILLLETIALRPCAVADGDFEVIEYPEYSGPLKATGARPQLRFQGFRGR